VASQRWYVENARALLAAVSPAKVILAVGAYGHEWNDAEPDSSTAVTFQEAMRAARNNDAHMVFDPASLNPYLRWTDADSTDHVIWYLDGVTAYNQLRAGAQSG
jgi:spore germination protein YaaH